MATDLRADHRLAVPAMAMAVLACLCCWSPAAQASPFGINAHIPSAQLLDQVAEAGIGWVRIDFLWRLVEPEQDRFEWRTYDRLVDGLSSRGLRIFATISATPTWATDGDGDRGVPRDPADWRDLCYRVAARYRGRVDAWGMWNEPNLESFWEGTRAEYIDQILIAGGQAVHAADPGALVCGPELAHIGSEWDTWLADVLARASSVLDVVTHHVYPGSRLHEDIVELLVHGGSQPWEAPSVRKILVDGGWWGRPFWVTEIGLESGAWGERTQAAFYSNVLDEWFADDRSRWWIDRIFFYELQDARFVSSFGLIAASPVNRKKEAYAAYADFIAASQVDDAELVSSSVPAFLPPLTTVSTSLTLLNTGSSTWQAGSYRLQLSNAADWQVHGDDLEILRPVPPGTTVTLTPTITSPAVSSQPFPTSVHSLSWRMAHVGRWSFGQPSSNLITVTSQEPVAITSQPRPVGAVVGQSATFSITTTGEVNVFYRWLRNSFELADGVRFSGVFTPTLTVFDVDHDITGEYYCVVTIVTGGFLKSKTAALVINAEPRHIGGRRTTITGSR